MTMASFTKSANLLRRCQQAFVSRPHQPRGCHQTAVLRDGRKIGRASRMATTWRSSDFVYFDHRRCFASSNKNTSKGKKQAMKRQMERNPTSSSPQDEPSRASPASGSFAATMDVEQPIFSSNHIFPPLSTSSPLQASPFSSNTMWETDKNRLSSLPDDAAMLMDKEELFDPSIHLPYAPKDWKGYEPATPLSDFIMQRIGVAGRPITIAEYMRHVLTHPQHGYYTNSQNSKPKTSGEDDFDINDWDQPEAMSMNTTNTSPNTSRLIGPRGDFITAPEVSHVFGHCICVWFVTQWKSALLNQPSKIQLVELGPGRGTLMVDLLQLATTSKLQDFGEAIQVVNLIEASNHLRRQQEMSLRDTLGHLIDFEFVHVSGFPSNNRADEKTPEASSLSSQKFKIRVEWHDSFASFQRQRRKEFPVFMVSQEFLDALPVHSFQKTNEGWRERLIDVASVEEEQPNDLGRGDEEPKLLPRLRQVLAPDVTPAVELFLEPNRQYDQAAEGTVVEICPEAMVLAQGMSQVLEESQGVALMIDYGQDGTSDTLRAFSNHRQVALTSYPGQVDVTADVDFFALRNSIGVDSNQDVPEERKVHAFGPVTQGEFLMRMGAADMVISSIEQDDTSPEQAQKLTDALKYLVLPEHMGERFKALALAPKRDGIFAPAGMEK